MDCFNHCGQQKEDGQLYCAQCQATGQRAKFSNSANLVIYDSV